MTEKEKMLAGELYDALDPELVRDRNTARERCRELAVCDPTDVARAGRILGELFGAATEPWVQPPFFCDYGRNIHLGRKVYFNFNCVVLDVTTVRIGDYTLFGPAVQIYTAMHPIDAEERRCGLEFAKPVMVGADVWVGGGAVLCPGITIGDRTVIGAGSVVTRNIPADVFAAGNPCRVIRGLKQSDV